MAEAQSHIEIPISELEPYAPHFREAVEIVCESRFFRSSPKSCEFLRHIVHRTLEGNTSELKERLIGMSLFGRVATYDTGSDATVRVRANDVRKRLATEEDVALISGQAQEASDKGISGVPTFVFAQKYAVSGAQPADQLARAIRQVSAELNAQAAE